MKMRWLLFKEKTFAYIVRRNRRQTGVKIILDTTKPIENYKLQDN